MVCARVFARGEAHRTPKRTSDASRRKRAPEKRSPPTPKPTLKLAARVTGQCKGDSHRAHNRAAWGLRQEYEKQALEQTSGAYLVAQRGSRRVRPLWTRSIRIFVFKRPEVFRIFGGIAAKPRKIRRDIHGEPAR